MQGTPKNPIRSLLVGLAAVLATLPACGAQQAPEADASLTTGMQPDPVPQTWSTVVSSTSPSDYVPASVGIVAPDGMEFTEGYPFRLTVRSPSHPAIAPIVLEAGDATQRDAHNVAFTVQCPAREVGLHEYVATFRYSVCTATRCIPGEVDVSWTVNVR